MKLFKVIIVIILISVASCTKDCDVLNNICNEKPPNELCQEFFTRWFYNKSNNKCEKKSYSGCRQYGFATEQECSECKCR